MIILEQFWRECERALVISRLPSQIGNRGQYFIKLLDLLLGRLSQCLALKVHGDGTQMFWRKIGQQAPMFRLFRAI